MSPPFIFRIDEIVEHPTAPVVVNSQGHWEPSIGANAHTRLGGGVSGSYWLCNGQRIYRVSDWQLPAGSSLYSVYSVYYCAGYGFWVLRADATVDTDEAWKPLRFEHDENDFSSYLTNAGTAQTLRCQRPDQQWPRMLLPDIYQTHPMPTHQTYGGLKGDLAIFLALLAFSMSREDLQQYITHMFSAGAWQVHGLPHGRLNQRGVVVHIYTASPQLAPGSTHNELRRYENGQYNRYYN